MSKPKLELQINIPTTIRLLQTEPVTGENSYGQWWLYNVYCDGQEYSYFAPEKVVKLLKEKNVCKDDEVVITKKLIKNGKKNTADYDLQFHEKEYADQNAIKYERTNGATINGNHAQNRHQAYKNGSSDDHSSDYDTMLKCMTDAMMLRDELGHDVDVNKLGITLFLRKVKA